MAERLAGTQEDYVDSLARLARKSTATNRLNALACGRELMGVIEEAKTWKLKVPFMTEMTIQNDLQAAAG